MPILCPDKRKSPILRAKLNDGRGGRVGLLGF